MLRPQDNSARETKRLDGIWDFVVDFTGIGRQQRWWEYPLTDAQKMPVPSSYNDVVVDAAVHDHVGDVWYQRTVFVPRGWTGMRPLLRFDAATHRATVWVDDTEVLEHEGGYTPFEVDVTDIVRPGESFRLTVVVSPISPPSPPSCGSVASLRAIGSRSSPPTSCGDAGSARADGAGRVPLDECSEELLAGWALRQHGDGVGAGFARRHTDGGERRSDHGRHGDIIEPDYADVARHRHAKVAQSGDDPESHLVVERHDGRRRTVHHSFDHGDGSLEGRTGSEHLLHFKAKSPTGLPDCVATLPGRPRCRRATQIRQGAMTVGLEMAQHLGDSRSRPKDDRSVMTDRTVDEDGRRGAEHVECTVQTPRRDHDEAVDLPDERLRGAHFFLPVLARVDQEHLQLGLPGCSLDRPHQRREVGVGDVRHDHCHIAGAAGDQPSGGAAGNESQFPYRSLDSLPGLRCHPVREVERPRDGGGVDAGARGNIEDGDSLRLPHATRPYSGSEARRLGP